MTRFYVAAHGAIRNGNTVLVVHRASTDDYMPGTWDFPGGKLEAGEVSKEGLAREVREETGLNIQIGNTAYVFSGLEELPVQQHFQLIYDCEYQGGDIVLRPEEHDEYKWVTLRELQDMNLIHFVRSWLDYKQAGNFPEYL